MKKLAILVLVIVLVAVASIGIALAVPPGRTIEFAGGAQGKVIFSGQAHADAGNKCNDCHNKIFTMKRGAVKITFTDHQPGKFCGACHDGTKAFSQKGNCTKCHKK